jgi:hypothetical protein
MAQYPDRDEKFQTVCYVIYSIAALLQFAPLKEGKS